jgi:hypothetical protein
MITIEFLPDEHEVVEALVKGHPDSIRQVKTRHSMGGGVDHTLLITLTAMAIPVIKTALLEIIRAGRFKSFSYKGLKVTGHGSSDIEKILTSLRDAGVTL